MLRFFKHKPEGARARIAEAVHESRKSWSGRIIGMLHRSSFDENLWEQLEEILISADVGVDTSLVLVNELRLRAQRESLVRPEQVLQVLKETMELILQQQHHEVYGSLNGEIESVPHVILVVGVNGVGKTTTIGKLAFHYREMGCRVILAAGDTFRAAGIEQLQTLGASVGVDVVAHRSGADPGAVAFDAFQAARARGADVLIVDTAGRLHTKANLMEELKKIRSVLNRLDSRAPHQVLMVLDATIGHNGLTQARAFVDSVGCTGVFLSKLDGTAKGGIVLAVKKELGLPILFIGTGEKLEDLALFDSGEFIEALLTPIA